MDIYQGLIEACGIQRGDTIDLISDLSHIVLKFQENGETFDPNQFIDALCEAVGKEGTVLIRTFSWDFCHGRGWDYRKSRSQVGALGNFALKRNDFKRTRHPIYSWMVWGKMQGTFCRLDNRESFSEDSVFAWEYKNPSHMIILGDPNTTGITIYHYVEEHVGVPYRYIKNFEDIYVDENGQKEKRTYSMYVRSYELEVSETHVSPYFPVLKEIGALEENYFLGIRATNIDIPKACQVFEKDIRENASRKAVSYIGQ